MGQTQGSKVFDLEGKEYIDLCTSFGSALLGHSHPQVLEAIGQALEKGLMCAYESESQAKLAQRICR